MRGFILGVLLAVAVTTTILSLRPGGIRRQLRFAARRFRLFLVLGGVYVLASSGIRLVFKEGPIAEWGPIAIAVVVSAVFIVLARDPVTAAPGSGETSRAR